MASEMLSEIQILYFVSNSEIMRTLIVTSKNSDIFNRKEIITNSSSNS